MPVTLSQAGDTLGLRITKLRKEKNETQQEFSQHLAEYAGRKEPYVVSTISSWEHSLKAPRYNTLYQIAGYFGVSINYLLGTTDKREIEEDSEDLSIQEMQYGPRPISTGQMQSYHRKPVFAVFTDHKRPDQWALFDATRDVLILLNGEVKFDQSTIQLYPMDMYSNPKEERRRSLSPTNAQQLDMVWLEMTTPDQEVQLRFNGWYRNSQDKRFLIKEGDGEVLPYTGAGVSYRLYRKP